jgi:hypothetical protein
MIHAKNLVSTVKGTPETIDHPTDELRPEGIDVAKPEHHVGMTLMLNSEMLERLGLSTDAEPGDECHLCCECRVESVHKSDGGDMVHLQIVRVGAPEGPEDEEEERHERFYHSMDADLGDSDED